MVKVGIIGLGFMGQTHFKIYQKLVFQAEDQVAFRPHLVAG